MKHFIEVSFPGGKKVDARVEGFTIQTDQSAAHGGEATMPEPFQHFLASLATCGGLYALEFCRARSIPTEGLVLGMEIRRDQAGKRVERIVYDLTLPDGFPEKYRTAIRMAIDQCTVKRHVVDPPEFEIRLRESADETSAVG